MLNWFHKHLTKPTPSLGLPKRYNDATLVDSLISIYSQLNNSQLKHLDGRYRSLKGFPCYYGTIDKCLREHYNLQGLLGDLTSLTVERHRMGSFTRQFTTLDDYLDDYVVSDVIGLGHRIVRCLKTYKQRVEQCDLSGADRYFDCIHYDLYHFTVLILGEVTM